MQGNRVWSILIVLALLLIAAGLFWPQSPEAPSQASFHQRAPAGLQGLQGGPIELPISNRAGPLSLDDFRGSHVWLYFGYTSCPDACPMSLGIISSALAQLPPAWQERVQGLFISVDPERDTADRLRAYANHFHPRITAATGPHDRLRDIAGRYGVYYQHTEVESALGYVVDHSSATYLVGPDGSLLAVHPHGTTSAQLLDGLFGSGSD